MLFTRAGQEHLRIKWDNLPDVERAEYNVEPQLAAPRGKKARQFVAAATRALPDVCAQNATIAVAATPDRNLQIVARQCAKPKKSNASICNLRIPSFVFDVAAAVVHLRFYICDITFVTFHLRCGICSFAFNDLTIAT